MWNILWLKPNKKYKIVVLRNMGHASIFYYVIQYQFPNFKLQKIIFWLFK